MSGLFDPRDPASVVRRGFGTSDYSAYVPAVLSNREQGTPSSGWFSDPTGRHEERERHAFVWSDRVRDKQINRGFPGTRVTRDPLDIPEGWYLDPASADGHRWWTSHAWTERVLDVNGGSVTQGPNALQPDQWKALGDVLPDPASRRTDLAERKTSAHAIGPKSAIDRQPISVERLVQYLSNPSKPHAGQLPADLTMTAFTDVMRRVRPPEIRVMLSRWGSTNISLRRSYGWAVGRVERPSTLHDARKSTESMVVVLPNGSVYEGEVVDGVLKNPHPSHWEPSAPNLRAVAASGIRQRRS